MNCLIEYISNNPKLQKRFEEVAVITEMVDSFKNNHPHGGEIVIISAIWCRDCINLIPIFGKISLILPEWEITLLNRDTITYEERVKLNVQRIPTFIFYDKKKKEIGRIVEKPKESLEVDISKF